MFSGNDSDLKPIAGKAYNMNDLWLKNSYK